MFSADIYVQMRGVTASNGAVIRTELVDEGQQLFSLIINQQSVSLYKGKIIFIFSLKINLVSKLFQLIIFTL